MSEKPIAASYRELRMSSYRNDELENELTKWSTNVSRALSCLTEWYILDKLVDFEKCVPENVKPFIVNLRKITTESLLVMGAINPVEPTDAGDTRKRDDP